MDPVRPKYDVERLDCYQCALALVVQIDKVAGLYTERKNFPLADQIRRAVISIPTNLAEGFGRSTSKEFARFVSIARGSTYEVQTLLRIGSRLGYIQDHDHEELQRLLSNLLGKLTNFERYLRRNGAPYLK